MKAKLILRIDENDGDDFLELLIILDSGKVYPVTPEYIIVDSSDKENYLSKIDFALNEAQPLTNAIPGLKLVIDQSVCEYIEGSEEEIKSYVKQMVVEL